MDPWNHASCMCLFEISGIDMVRLLAAKKLFGGGRCGVLGDKIVTPIIHKGEAKPAANRQPNRQPAKVGG